MEANLIGARMRGAPGAGRLWSKAPVAVESVSLMRNESMKMRFG